MTSIPTARSKLPQQRTSGGSNLVRKHTHQVSRPLSTRPGSSEPKEPPGLLADGDRSLSWNQDDPRDVAGHHHGLNLDDAKWETPPASQSTDETTCGVSEGPMDQQGPKAGGQSGAEGQDSASASWGFPSRPKPSQDVEPARASADVQSVPEKSSSLGEQHHSDTRFRFPWTGDQPEDVLSEHSIRNGFSAKSRLANETNTARPTLWPHLKNQTGLQRLSEFFGQVLEDQRERGRITGSSTFKPPPRVTLTDLKRESWLKDLANPQVPLRKQSRTIPHGISGKMLLEQCLSKMIPLMRAVWLTKCVGASELRAFRRKGVTATATLENEARWILMWTTTVESFLEEQIALPSRPESRSNLTYVLRLAVRLFQEGLLNIDHYLNWITRLFSSSQIDQLPITMVLAQRHANDFVADARLAHRLAEGCVLQLASLSDHETYAPVKAKLWALLGVLIGQSRYCLILSSDWLKAREILTEKLASTTATPLSPLQGKVRRDVDVPSIKHLLARNDNFTRSTHKHASQQNTRDTTFLTLLDGFSQKQSLEGLSSELIGLSVHKFDMVTSLLRWSASIHRPGIHRIYLACRLMRHWENQGMISVAHCTYDAIGKLRECRTICPKSLGRLVAEFIRSGHFEVARYLRSLLAMGNGISTLDREIMENMPRTYIPGNLFSLRDMISKTSPYTSSRKLYIATLALNLVSLLGQPPDANQGGVLREELVYDLAHLTVSDAFELSRLLHEHLKDWLTLFSSQGIACIPSPTISVALWIFQQLDDHQELYRGIASLAQRSDPDGLYLCASSIEGNLDIFSALGHLTSFWKSLFLRYRTLRSSHAPHQDICRFFLRTVDWIGPNTAVVEYLKRELEFCDNAAAACTPLSDLNADVLMDQDDDLDRILANGVTMDSKQLRKVLTMLVERIPWDIDHVQQSSIRSILSSLHSANETIFNEALRVPLLRNLDNGTEESLSRILSTLIYANCISISDLASMADAALTGTSKTGLHNAPPAVAKGLLLFLFPMKIAVGAMKEDPKDLGADAVVSAWNASRWSALFTQNHKKTFMRCVSSCLTVDEVVDRERVVALFCTPAFVEAFRRTLLMDPDLVFSEIDDTLAKQATEITSSNLDALVASVSAALALGDASKTHVTEQKVDQPNAADAPCTQDALIRLLFSTVDATSLPFYQFALHYMGESGRLQHVADICLDQAQEASERNCAYWPRLLWRMDQGVAKRMRLASEEAILCSPSSFVAFTNRVHEPWRVRPGVYADVVEAVELNAPKEDVPNFGRRIGRHLHWILQASSDTAMVASATFLTWTEAILRIFTIHHDSEIDPPIFGQLLYQLCRLLVDDNLQAHTNLMGNISDLLSHFIPRASSQCLVSVRQKLEAEADDPRIRFFIGSRPESDSIFHLVSDAAASDPSQQSSDSTSVTCVPFPLRNWELLPDAAPHAASNDAALSLKLFDARKVHNIGRL